MADAETSNCLLPPSPNWYCSSASDCSVSGIYAFAAKNHVFLLDTNSDPPVFREQFKEHSDRTSGVSCCPHVLSSLCASASDDKTVKIWDMKSKIVVASHNTHHAKITCLCWSSVESDLIFSADEKGTIIAWRHNKNVVYSVCPIQEYVFSIAASHHSEQLAVAGYKNGLIIVLKLNEHGITVTHRLRGHDGDIHSLAWCPVSIDQLDLGPLQDKALNSKGNLIISGSRDQTIRLWDTLNGKLLTIFNLPKRSSQKWRDRHDWQSKDRLWLALCWPKSLPNKLISSSHSGELIQWSLSIPSGSEQIQHFAQGHSRIVFNICCNKEGTKAISISMDRQIIIWDLKTLRSVHSISSLGGFVYTLDISPLDPGTVAIGVGDNMIRVWQTASPSSAYQSVTLWQGVKSKVQVVCWHPHQEGILGFGTDSGQVGIYNTVSKKPKVFASYHKNTVYSLSWGPACPENEDKNEDNLSLYSCSGDGSILQHRPNHPLQDAINVNSLIQSTNKSKHKFMSCTEVAWNCNGTALGIGSQDGTIEVFTPPSLRRVCTIFVHKKSITYLAWHPGYGDDDVNGEGRLPYRLASGSNETAIHIHDLSDALRTCDATMDTPTSITTSYRRLVGHGSRITSLCWSPHHCNMLVSASYDGTAQLSTKSTFCYDVYPPNRRHNLNFDLNFQWTLSGEKVWDVETNQTLANFRGHVGRLLSVQWSYLDANTVYSGGEDGSVRPWSIVGQKYTQPPTSGGKTSKNKKKSKSKQKEAPNSKVSQREPETTLETTLQAETASQDRPEYNDPLVKAQVKPDPEVEAEQKLSWRRPETTMIANSSQFQGSTSVVAHALKNGELQENNSVVMATIDDDDAGSVGSVSTQESGPTVIFSKSKGEVTKKKRKFKSMFPLSAVADNNTRVSVQQDCIALAQFLSSQQPGDGMASAIPPEPFVPGESSNVNLGFFADRSSAYKMVDAEGRHHCSANNLDYKLQLEIWKGNLGGALQMAIEAKQLNDWLVAVSALAGHDVWLHTVESYAEQLRSEGAFHRAVLYYLACHKVYQAIDVFIQQSMYREAIALAKVRLSPSDPVLHDLYCSWARKLESEHYENAAKCYLAAGLPAEAVRVLSIRGDLPSLSTALKVSVVSGQHQLSTSLAVRVLHVCMGTGNWCAAEEALTLCSGIEGHLCVLLVHEILVEELQKEGVISENEFREQCHTKDFTSTEQGQRHSVIENSFNSPSQEVSPWILDPQSCDWVVSRILKAWDRAGVLTLQGSRLQSAIEQLSSYSQTNLNENLAVKQILTRISYDISHGLLCGVQKGVYSCSLPWLRTLESCIRNNYFNLAQFLCVRLLPRGSQSLEDISALQRELNTKSESIAPRVSKEHEFSSENLFGHFSGFYNILVLYKIWLRDAKVLALFSGSQVNETEDSVITFSREITAVGNVAVFKVAERIANEIASSTENAAKSQENQVVPSSEVLTEDNTTNGTKEPLSASSISNEAIPMNPGIVSLDMYAVLCSIQESLLGENLVVCATLKKQLLEAKKEVILLRSRRILDSVAAASTAKQKRSSNKKTKSKQSSKGDAERLGSSPKGDAERLESSPKGDAERLESSPKGDAERLESSDNTSTLIGSNESEISEVCESSSVVNQDNEDAASSEKSVSRDTLSWEPLDVRYKSGAWSLELMQQEEHRLMEELSQHFFKDLPFPDPTESAMIIGYVCTRAFTYPCLEPTVLHKLGLEVVTSALEHAQWTAGRKILGQLEKRLLQLNT